MPFLVPVFGAIFSAIGGIVGGLAGLGKLILGVLINVGLSLLQMLLAPKPPKPEDVRQVIRQEVPIRQAHVGVVGNVGGYITLMEVKNRILHMVQYFGEGPAVQFLEWRIDGRIIEAPDTETGFTPTEPIEDWVYLWYRYGVTPETPYRQLIETFPTVIDESFRGDGLVTAYTKTRSPPAKAVNKILPNKHVNVTVTARWAKPYDPRHEDYRFTTCLPLIERHYLINSDGMNIPEDLIDDDDFTGAANIADQVVQTRAGGTVQRYHGSLTWRFDEEPRDVLDRLHLMMDGRLYLKPNGKIGFKCGAWETPTVHIPDEAIVEAELNVGGAPIRQASEVTVKYSNPNTGYTPAAAETWRNDEVIALDGGRSRRRMIPECYGIQNHNHARRVAKLIDQDANPEIYGTIKTDLRGMEAWDQRFITMDYAPFNIVGGYFQIQSIGRDDDDMLVVLTVASTTPQRYDFDAATEEGTPQTDPERLEDDAVPEVENFAAFVRTRLVNGNVRAAYIEMSCDAPEDGDDMEAEFQIAPRNTVTFRRIGDITDQLQAETGILDDGSIWDVRCRYVTSGYSFGPWTVIEDIEMVADDTAPSVPTSVSVSVSEEDATQATVAWRAPDSENYYVGRVYRGTTNDADAASSVDTVPGLPRASYTSDDAPGTGTFYYFVSAANGSGVESARVAAGSVTI